MLFFPPSQDRFQSWHTGINSLPNPSRNFASSKLSGNEEIKTPDRPIHLCLLQAAHSMLRLDHTFILLTAKRFHYLILHFSDYYYIFFYSFSVLFELRQRSTIQWKFQSNNKATGCVKNLTSIFFFFGWNSIISGVWVCEYSFLAGNIRIFNSWINGNTQKSYRHKHICSPTRPHACALERLFLLLVYNAPNLS